MIMNKQDVIKWLLAQENNEKMPKYIEAHNVNRMQVMIDGNWTNIVYAWGILLMSDKYAYFETDDERGYISDLKRFSSEQEACEYAKKMLEMKLRAYGGNSKSDMAVRYIENTYNYSESRAKKMVENLCAHKDIFEEFFEYVRLGKFAIIGVTVRDYTAEKLFNEYNLSPLGAYNFLIYLREEPDAAVADLKKGLPRR